MSNKSTSDFMKKALEEERNRLANSLQGVLDGDLGDTKYLLTGDDLDRLQAENDLSLLVDKFDIKEKEEVSICSPWGAAQESQRLRRDIVISRPGHKKLVFGALETMYRRMKKLEKTINAED